MPMRLLLIIAACVLIVGSFFFMMLMLGSGETFLAAGSFTCMLVAIWVLCDSLEAMARGR